MNKVDDLIFKAYGNYPCFSPGRYAVFFPLTKFLKTESLKKDKIIEIGCGSGHYALFLDHLLKSGFYTGIDLEFKQDINNVKKKVKNIKADFKIMAAQKLIFRDNCFNLVLSLWSLEHIKDDDLTLGEIYRILKKGGTFLVAVPSIYTYPFQLGRHGFHYYRKGEIISKLKKNGFKIKEVICLGGLIGYLFSLWQNWLDLLVLAPFAVFFKIFKTKKLKGDSRQDIGGGFAKKIISNTIGQYRKTKIGRKIHFGLLRLIRIIDNYFPILPTSYFLVAEK